MLRKIFSKINNTITDKLAYFGAIWDNKVVITILKLLLYRLVRSKTSGITLEVALLLIDSIINSSSNDITDIDIKTKDKDKGII